MENHSQNINVDKISLWPCPNHPNRVFEKRKKEWKRLLYLSSDRAASHLLMLRLKNH